MVGTQGNNQPERRCIIVNGNTVTGVCSELTPMAAPKMCETTDMVKIAGVPAIHTSISGTVSTTNIIMANWSRMMWQIVFNRAVRLLASSPLRLHFFSASATVRGN
ncbi:hypothetical protein KIN20_026843 [Parelaphostrongylus tenuis]|uniref:Uncharacterized protein n=1 Tax=Parelaphostrongylus tenuis TaxID=148309 RepID=A0AAD5WDG2_PARTN|nr:hypothetical protein KIN20_026843 [Parelaphostrongylus tenuis]